MAILDQYKSTVMEKQNRDSSDVSAGISMRGGERRRQACFLFWKRGPFLAPHDSHAEINNDTAYWNHGHEEEGEGYFLLHGHLGETEAFPNDRTSQQ